MIISRLPSFTSAVVSPDRVVLTAIDKVFALCGATIATIIMSNCDIASPGFAMIVGIPAGILSVVGYNIIAPRLQKLIRGTDTCGVHNLHGMPGLLGGLSVIVLCGNVKVQLLGMIVTVVIALVGGRIEGAIIGLLGTKAVAYSDEGEFK